MTHVLGQNADHLTRTRFGRLAGAVGALDPRVRILGAVAFGMTVVSLNGLLALGLALAVALGLLGLSHLPLRATLLRMAMVDGFIIVMLVFLPFTMPGDVMFTLWGYPASWQGLWRAVQIALTANAVVLVLMTLVGTLEPVTLGHALHKLRVPETLVHLLMFTIRYIEVLREEYLRLRAAMKVRGFRPGTNWHTYRSIGYLVGMMLVRAIERSERILGAMKCRGFSGRIYLLQEFALTRADAVFASLGLGALAALIWVDLLWR
ncbi:cobalt ECF transporter T component CbiQ [Tropicibacter naphthalenivorans]|uniref:Cobalt transport protein CbiQ n=1 Tax=Tropicibacter naphthalenivorans TaxID=441103 RepID=A0A0P1GG10_9RHOB|nr:cobalt ECF transporter T component CbiQ [Tropicibacter naphthalenivorans]CUH80803.1 cobalt transport protein CbiQ [Tropicibacter naphthalenivorans]SMC90321.1 cobalt/nickel transport system permease protein [Tropicibacter naphthalenivorans]